MILIGGAGGAAGGGKGQQQQPKQEKPYEPKTTRVNIPGSNQYATIVDLLSEGEIAGLVVPGKEYAKGVFLNGTALQNPDGTYNFQPDFLDFRVGTQSQGYSGYASNIENEIPVGAAVVNGSPLVRTITNPQIDAVRMTFSFQGLEKYTKKGDRLGASIDVRVEVQNNGGGFTPYVIDTIQGRSDTPFQKDYEIQIYGPFPVDIRISRTKPTSDPSQERDLYSWSSYTEIIYSKLSYPNSAYSLLRVQAEQFPSIPSRQFLIRGIKIKIPNNAYVDWYTGRLIYSGAWDGTFGPAQWCKDPVWILWDLLTSTRYGFGDHIKAADLDRWAFYSASLYANELVPDGRGGYEQRFACNVNIQTAEEAYDLVNDLCSVFRAMPYWSTGGLTLAQDRPQDPSYAFTMANVQEEGFSYQSGPLKGRPNMAVVSYFNNDLRDTDYHVVEDAVAIARNGLVRADVKAFGCTSRGQAERVGKWLLYTENYESEIETHAASVDAGVIVRPGSVITVSDPVRAGTRRGGRIRYASAGVITVDDSTGLPTSGGTLSAIMPDGTVQTRAVWARYTDEIYLAAPFTTAPLSNSVWIYETPNIQTSLWRTVSIQEEDGAKYSISSVKYDPSKYNYVEYGWALQPRDITDLNITPPSPDGLGAREVLYESNGKALSKIIISWQPVSGVLRYGYRWRQGFNNWTSGETEATDLEIPDTAADTYQIEVFSKAANLRASSLPSALAFAAVGKTALPNNVTGLGVLAIDDASAILTWDRAVDLDVNLGGRVQIRHSVRTDNPPWGDAVSIIPAASGNQTQKQVPLLEGSYLLRFEDDGGRLSPGIAYATIDLPAPLDRFLVQSYAEDQESPPFNGNAIEMLYSATLDGLILGSGVLFDSHPDVSLVPLIIEGEALYVAPGYWPAGYERLDTPVAPFGEYEFGSTFDMGAGFDVNIQRRFVTRAISQGDRVDTRAGLVSDWPLFAGVSGGNVDAVMQVRTNPGPPSEVSNWSAWREFANGIVHGRSFQFKVVATSTDTTENILIDELGVIMELQQRTERSATLASGAATYSATFAHAFYEPPNVGISVANMGTGDYFALSNVTRTGFDVVFRNAAGTAVSRNFSYVAVGFGRQG